MLAMGAAVAMIVAAAAFYLASPHQKLIGRTMPRRLLAGAGLVFSAAALVLLLQLAGPATSVFILLTGLMLLWTVPPLLIAYLRARREAS